MRWRSAVILRIASNETRLLLTDGRLPGGVVVLLALFAASFWTGWHNYIVTSQHNREAEREDRTRWLNQGIKGPHAAADQGLMIFRPLPALAAFDPGILAFTGSQAVLGGHHEEMLTAKDAEGFHSLHRLGSLSAAATLQRFVPLILILLLYGAVASERERGTLRQIRSLGVSGPELVAGKLLGATLPLLGIIAVLAAAVSWPLTASWSDSAALARLAVLGFGYLGYFAIVAALVLTVSIRVATAKQALASLLGCWCFACMLAPALVADFAQWISPSPTSLDHAVALMDANRRLPTVEERRAELRGRLLQQYHAASLRDLPVDPIGIELLEEARDEEPVFHALAASVYDAYERQNRIYQAAGLLSPMLAIQSVSMTLCGSDLADYRGFTQAAERYRQIAVRMLNEAIAYNPNYRQSAVFPGTDIIVSLGGPELWQRVPEFHYTPAGFGTSWTRALSSIVILCAWMVFAGLLIWRAAARLRVD